MNNMEHETSLKHRLSANMTNAFTISFTTVTFTITVILWSTMTFIQDTCIYHHIGMWTLSLPSLTTDEFWLKQIWTETVPKGMNCFCAIFFVGQICLKGIRPKTDHRDCARVLWFVWIFYKKTNTSNCLLENPENC